MTNNIKKKRVRRDRRDEILEAATKLFSVYGFRGTSLAAVAKVVDLTEPGVLHYFPSKVHLLQGVLAYRDQQDEKKYAALTQLDKVSLNKIFKALENLVAENETKSGLVRLFTVLVGESIREDHPSHDYFVNRYNNIREGLFELLNASIKTDDLKSDIDITYLSSIIIAMMDGLQIQWLLDPENINMTETFNLFLKIIRSYLEEHTT